MIFDVGTREVKAMTNAELVRKITRQGCKFFAHGGSHDVYINPLTGGKARILRHWSQQVKPKTLSNILKDLSLK